MIMMICVASQVGKRAKADRHEFSIYKSCMPTCGWKSPDASFAKAKSANFLTISTFWDLGRARSVLPMMRRRFVITCSMGSSITLVPRGAATCRSTAQEKACKVATVMRHVC